MTNTQHESSIVQPVGVIRTSYTVSIAFAQKPNEELRKKLKASGYKFENGNWYRNQTDGNLATNEKVHELLAA